jgi:hypothetical protein
MDEGKRTQLTSVANLLSDQLIRDVPLHTFRPRLAVCRRAVRADQHRHAPGGLVARLQPAQ